MGKITAGIKLHLVNLINNGHSSFNFHVKSLQHATPIGLDLKELKMDGATISLKKC